MTQAEAAARKAVERRNGRPYTDDEWIRVHHELLAFARILARWHAQRADPTPIVSVAIGERSR